jgi:hypothetical protein
MMESGERGEGFWKKMKKNEIPKIKNRIELLHFVFFFIFRQQPSPSIFKTYLMEKKS